MSNAVLTTLRDEVLSLPAHDHRIVRYPDRPRLYVLLTDVLALLDRDSDDPR